MSEDEALKEWLDTQLKEYAGVSQQQGGMTVAEHCARAAWHAAVEYTLTFVAEACRIQLDNESVADFVVTLDP